VLPFVTRFRGSAGAPDRIIADGPVRARDVIVAEVAPV
jgi:hypothetical protein